jgi:hypothetical protein
MEKRPFMDKDAEPEDEKLKQTLEDSYDYYNELMEVTDSFLKDWNFSKSSGWMLKVHDKKKALFYVIPFKGEFKISMAIRENERKAFLDDGELSNIHNMLKSSKKYREGYALRFDVKNEENFQILNVLIKKLIDFRI